MIRPPFNHGFPFGHVSQYFDQSRLVVDPAIYVTDVLGEIETISSKSVCAQSPVALSRSPSFVASPSYAESEYLETGYFPHSPARSDSDPVTFRRFSDDSFEERKIR
jgi:hypothetical protein